MTGGNVEDPYVITARGRLALDEGFAAASFFERGSALTRSNKRHNRGEFS